MAPSFSVFPLKNGNFYVNVNYRKYILILNLYFFITIKSLYQKSSMKTYRKPYLITDKSTRELTYNKESTNDDK